MGRYEEAIRTLEGTKTLNSLFISLKTKYKEEIGVEYKDINMEKIEAFTKWLHDGGAKFDKVKMKYYGKDYRGVHAFKAIKKDDVILNIPKHLIITPQRGRDTNIGKLVIKSGITISWDHLFYITLFLLEQFHNEKSSWKPYMDMYPRDVSSFPMFYSAKEKKMLKGSPMLEHIVSEYEEIKAEYEKVARAVPEFRKFTLDEYMKNKMLAISRIFFVKMHGVDDRIMVPLADMFNHHYEKVGQTQWRYEDKKEAFIVDAKRNIPIGDAVLFYLILDMRKLWGKT